MRLISKLVAFFEVKQIGTCLHNAVTYIVWLDISKEEVSQKPSNCFPYQFIFILLAKGAFPSMKCLQFSRLFDSAALSMCDTLLWLAPACLLL